MATKRTHAKKKQKTRRRRYVLDVTLGPCQPNSALFSRDAWYVVSPNGEGYRLVDDDADPLSSNETFLDSPEDAEKTAAGLLALWEQDYGHNRTWAACLSEVVTDKQSNNYRSNLRRIPRRV